jgi:hypothetical protein
MNDLAEGSDDFSEFDGVDDGLAGKIKQFKVSTGHFLSARVSVFILLIVAQEQNSPRNPSPG